MIDLDHLLEATRGTLLSQGRQTRFDAFSHDTRQLVPGELFVAVPGEHSDGHDYLLDALQRGATGLLVEARYINALPHDTLTTLQQSHTPIIVVPDTRLALQHYASYILARWHPTVIAVTGSVGKTTTKEAIATVLSHNFATFRSWQNYNDLLGLPLSLGRLEPRHEYAIVELGCDHPGEITALCRLVQPHIGILTNIWPVQLQYFGTLEQLAEELSSLLAFLPPDGYALFDTDNPLTQLQTARLGHQLKATQLPFTPSQAHHVQTSWDGLRFTLALPQEKQQTGGPASVRSLQLATRLLGQHYISTMLIAYTLARHCGMHIPEIQQVLEQVTPLPGRLHPLAGLYGSRLLDDTHNATEASMIAGVETLHRLATGPRIAILGDMLHLGDYEEEAHRKVGRAAAHRLDYLITRGERAALIAEEAHRAGLPKQRIIATSTHEDAAQAARHIVEQTATATAQRFATVLIKGSEETRMERVTELLLAHPDRAREQLVRQTPGWKQIVVTRPERPTWVEIDLGAIANNTRRMKELVGPNVQVLVSLKADAYGHGAIKVARTVLHNGATMLGVATLSEATPLREASISAPILIFGYIPLWQMREAVRQDVTLTLYTLEAAQALSRAAQALGKTARVHVKIDTGMARLGVRAEQIDDILALLEQIKTLPGLELEGLFTHFATADSTDKRLALMQLERFEQVLRAAERRGLRPPLIHAANSAATVSLPEAHYNIVRPGIAIYGLDPSSEVRLPPGFLAALAFKTLVAQVKMVPAGECVSYGCTFMTERPTRIATLPVGYADGFRRAPRNWGYVLIHGQKAPVIGRVCMDQCMVDVTDIPQVRMGDEVVLIGKQGTAALTAEMVAAQLGTINYEVVSEILARVPRVD